MLKQLTLDEVRQFVAAFDTYDDWALVKEFAGKFFPDSAVKVEVETDSEYNDQGGYYNIITDIKVYDAAGHLLDTDVSKLLAGDWLTQEQVDEYGDWPLSWRDAKDLNYDLDDSQPGINLDADDLTFDLTTEPALPFGGVLYAEVNEAA